MSGELQVWLHGSLVGQLTWREGRLSFTYAEVWLASQRASPLSQSLPLQQAPFDARQSRPFFAGLLPEAGVRRVLARRLQISDRNDFELLEVLGGECAGAVTFWPTGSVPPSPGGRESVRWLSDAELADILADLPHRPLMAGSEGLRLSLAGAQDKLPVVVAEDRIGLPVDGSPSSHVLKPAIASVTDSVANEAFCLALARAMGLGSPAAEMREVAGRSFLLVERYDRRALDDGGVRRLHQEDFCQALGVIPELKYQNEGGPGFAACFDLLRRALRPSAPHILRFFDIAVFNALIGNHDAHAKNFALLHDESLMLAPFYDLLSTAVYPRLTDKMAMKIGGRYRFSEIHERHWERFADEVGVSRAVAKRRILSMATHLPQVAGTMAQAAGQPFAGRSVITNIVDLISQRCALTVRRWAESGAESNDVESDET